MDFNTISFIFNRALSLTFSLKKLLVVFITLALSGILVVFFRGLAWHASHWVQLSLTFLPIFLCGGILLSMGIFLIRIYHNEIKNRHIKYREILTRSWQLVIGASYFSIPIILTYLLLWILLGIFVLLREIPMIGDFFSAILSFAPFIINLAALLLCLVSLLMLFMVSPILALKGIDRTMVFQIIVKRVIKDPFGNIILVLIGIMPLVFILVLLTLSAILTESICLDCTSLSQTVIKWFFMMLPFTAFLTPAIVFFFNFAAEAHVLLMRVRKESEF